MFSGARLRSLQEQQGDHHERAVVAIHHGDVACGKASEHRSQQGRLAGLFALVRSHRQVHYAGTRQRNDGHGPRDRQSHSGCLRFLLRVLGLVFGRVGHREREAVDQLRMVLAFPQPAFVGGLLQFFRHFAAQFVQRRMRKFGSSAAVVAGVLRRRVEPRLLAVAHDTSHRRLARSLFAVTQHLREKRPHHDRRGVDAMPSEQAAMLGKDALDSPGRENLGKR